MNLVRDPLTGVPLLCCWDDCGQYGQNGIQTRENVGPGKTLTYIFCTDVHRMYWVNSKRSYGNLPSGSRSALL